MQLVLNNTQQVCARTERSTIPLFQIRPSGVRYFEVLEDLEYPKYNVYLKKHAILLYLETSEGWKFRLVTDSGRIHFYPEHFLLGAKLKSTDLIAFTDEHKVRNTESSLKLVKISDEYFLFQAGSHVLRSEADLFALQSEIIYEVNTVTYVIPIGSVFRFVKIYQPSQNKTNRYHWCCVFEDLNVPGLPRKLSFRFKYLHGVEFKRM